MANHETVPWIGTLLALASLVVLGAAAIQVAFAWPYPARYIGPALLTLSIHGALILAFLAGNLWHSARDNVQSVRSAVAIAAVLAAWAGMWLGARDGLLVLAIGHLALAVEAIIGGWRAESRPTARRVALFCTVNAVALAIAAWLGPFG